MKPLVPAPHADCGRPVEDLRPRRKGDHERRERVPESRQGEEGVVLLGLVGQAVVLLVRPHGFHEAGHHERFGGQHVHRSAPGVVEVAAVGQTQVDRAAHGLGHELTEKVVVVSVLLDNGIADGGQRNHACVHGVVIEFVGLGCHGVDELDVEAEVSDLILGEGQASSERLAILAGHALASNDRRGVEDGLAEQAQLLLGVDDADSALRPRLAHQGHHALERAREDRLAVLGPRGS